MANPFIPDEILLEIFSRLPAKSIVKYRSLSKKWRTILSTKHFVKSHLARKPHQESFIYISSEYLTVHSIDKIEGAAAVVSRKIELPNKCMRVVGSCDGLVLLRNDEGGIFLLNPVTLQFASVLPASPTQALIHFKFGFGYDSSVDDYKIFRYYVRDLIVPGVFLDVYYVRGGFWKSVENPAYIPNHFEIGHGAFLNGAIHWLATKPVELDYRITAFDFAREVFDEIPLPIRIDEDGIVLRYKLVVFDGCLCLVKYKMNSGTDVWIMKEYGMAESWTKYDFRGELKPFCYIHGGEDVLVSKSESLHFYNLKERKSRSVVVDGGAVMLKEGCMFVGSIVSPFADN
ncbi:hypothetical protein ABFX02_06G170600 [Erythranthe guttata]